MSKNQPVDELREKLWDIMNRRNEKILAAQKTDALVLPYFEADDEAATEIIALIDAYTEQRVAETRIDELGEVLGRMIDWKNWGDLQDVYEELSKKLEGYEAQLKASTNQGGLEKPEETNNHE